MRLDKEYWDKRYLDKETGWDIGYVSTPLKEYFDQIKNKDLKILIPGAGNAYEAEYLYKNGFSNVFVLDISPVAIAEFKHRVPAFPWENIICDDFFLLHEQFDLIIEQTFFCALEPYLRSSYAKKMSELLVPKGKLVGLLFDTEFPKEGPPFGGSKEQYIKYFEPYFSFHTFESAYNSIKPRAEKELFINLVKK
jgi:methyl halide transferase